MAVGDFGLPAYVSKQLEATEPYPIVRIPVKRSAKAGGRGHEDDRFFHLDLLDKTLGSTCVFLPPSPSLHPCNLENSGGKRVAVRARCHF